MASLLDAFPEAVIFTTGDNAYSSGTEARTRPSPGNHYE
jgi:hypothetical protein